jgi:hypothetical protein
MRRGNMRKARPATRSAALAGVLSACLLLPVLISAPSASAAPRPITGKLDRRGWTVVALAPGGKVRRVRAKPGFALVPPGPVVTLQLRNRRGDYAGPIVVRGRGGRVRLGVRAGAKLGRIEVRDGYARTARNVSRRASDGRISARARRGVPVGVGALGWVRGRAHGPRGPGHDPDRDGIPSRFDVDDDGDLVLDARERGRSSGGLAAGGVPALLPLAACPASVCSGTITGDISDADTADVALVVAIAAAVLAAASLLAQLLAARGRRKRRVVVEVRLGLPIHRQGGGDWSVFVEVFNHTDHPVRWVSAALELNDGRRLYLMQNPPGGELPAVLAPHESHQTWIPTRELEAAGLDLTDPVVATAKLDTGETIASPRRRLVSRAAAKRRRG